MKIEKKVCFCVIVVIFGFGTSSCLKDKLVCDSVSRTYIQSQIILTISWLSCEISNLYAWE